MIDTKSSQKEMKFHHIGIASENIEQSKQFVKKIYDIKNISENIYDSCQDATLCMITLQDGTMIELISGNAIKSFIKRRQYLYHICFETSNFQKQIDKFLEEGSIMVSEPKPAVLLQGKKVCFIMTELGIVELLEK